MMFEVVHKLHKRLPYCIAAGIPRMQSTPVTSDYPIWSVSQDRMLVQYSLEQKQPLLVTYTCGGYVYSIADCPYDASKWV